MVKGIYYNQKTCTSELHEEAEQNEVISHLCILTHVN